MKKFTLLSLGMLAFSAMAQSTSGQGYAEWIQTPWGGSPSSKEGVVEATYLNGTLTIEPFCDVDWPINFVVNLEEGTATATNQIGGAYDETRLYYFCDLAKRDRVVYATIYNTSPNTCIMEVNPWGLFSPDFGGIVSDDYSDTVIVFEFAIPDLGSTVPDLDPELEIGEVRYNFDEDNGNTNFSVYVVANYLPEGQDVVVYYKLTSETDYSKATNEGTYYSFSFPDLKSKTDYSVEIYAVCGEIESETKNVDFTTPEWKEKEDPTPDPTPEPELTIGNVDYILTDNAATFTVSVNSSDLPVDGIINVFYKLNTASTYNIATYANPTYTFTLTGLEDATSYTVEIYAACGDIESAVKTVNFTTPEAEPVIPDNTNGLMTALRTVDPEWGGTDAEQMQVYVYGVYDNGKLTINNFGGFEGPIAFNVDFSNNTLSISPEMQLAYYLLDEADYPVYYYNPSTTSFNITGYFINDDANCIVTIPSWGEFVNGYDMQFEYASWTNTVIVFNFTMEGENTPEPTPDPVLNIVNATYVFAENGDATFTISVSGSDLPAGEAIEVYYKLGNASSYTLATYANPDYTFTLTNLEPATTYTVTVYAVCGDVSSNVKTIEFTTPKDENTGVSSIDAENEVRYFNLNGQEIFNPAPGTICIRVTTDKVSKVLVK